MYRELDGHGILVRYFGETALADSLRITVGTEEEQTVLLETLTTILTGGATATG